ncbi:sce7725 family protein [Pseudomonas nitroreducens]|uniref:sce7725 family protein n=1 Tax=Pseudomonas nitroreducens TaxID=46680 RepID=UPI0023F90398|nr:sce7725 family protein [Pseudomonas nitroreducens]WEW98316.1 sce7725 family protein [Pseudomonas nitroreducens]
MYYPILRGKRHELNAIVQLSSLPSANRCKPLLEPVNSSLNELISCIDRLASRQMVPYVIINPTLGDYAGVSSNVFAALQANAASNGKFIPCVKVLNAFDASINLVAQVPNSAVYLVSDVSQASVPLLNSASCVFANPQKLSGHILGGLNSVVLYQDSFAKQRRNADYPANSFFSNLHFSYLSHPNAIGVGDYTVMSEDYSEAGGPAYVVAIHATMLQGQPSNTLYVKHFCSTIQTTSPANPGGKFLEAAGLLMGFNANNPGVLRNTWGMSEFGRHYAAQHFPGLGVVKELSVEHHMETICSFI